MHNENLWLTQERIAELFGVNRTVISKHLKNIYEEEELEEISTSAKIAQVQNEGNREVKRDIKFYNLDAIIAISHEQAKEKAYAEYDEFNKTQKIESDFDLEIKKILDKNKEG